MASLWIKLYAEILDDYKYHTLKDGSKLLMYELFLLTRLEHGMDNSGILPSKDRIAFLLRRKPTFIEKYIDDLVSKNILAIIETGYIIVNFDERQKADPPNERTKAFRKRKNDVTTTLRECNEPVTNRYIDKNRIDIDKNLAVAFKFKERK